VVTLALQQLDYPHAGEQLAAALSAYHSGNCSRKNNFLKMLIKFALLLLAQFSPHGKVRT